MPRKKVSVQAKAEPERNVIRVMKGGTEAVRVAAVYHVPSQHCKTPGPWQGEADKISWIDEATGLHAIIRRSLYSGYLEGYVAVPKGHPLFGAKRGALVGLGIRVHGGVSYAAPCQKNEPEEVSICHVPSVEGVAIYAGQTAPQDHQDAWWFGFSCDEDGDLSPRASLYHASDPRFVGAKEYAYRDEAYVYRECVSLAAQLKALSDGRDPRGVNWNRARLTITDGRNNTGEM